MTPQTESSADNTLNQALNETFMVEFLETTKTHDRELRSSLTTDDLFVDSSNAELLERIQRLKRDMLEGKESKAFAGKLMSV